MTTIQVEVANRIIDVTYDPWYAHESFGEGGFFISDVIIIAEISKEKSLPVKRNIQESFRQALRTCHILKDDFEHQDQHFFVCEIANETVTTMAEGNNVKWIETEGIDIDYLHQLEAGVSKLVHMVMKILENVKTHYQIKVSLAFTSY